MEPNTASPRPAHDLPVRADVVVVGAGLAGLTAAALVARAGRTVVVLDGGVPGGRARTDEVSGHRLNRGAHALYDAGEGRRILRSLGVTWTGHEPCTAKGSLSLDGELFPLPGSAARALTSRLLGVREKASLARFMAALGRARPPASSSAEEWLAGEGPAGRAGALARTLLRVGSYTEPLGRLSADAAAAQLRLAMQGVTYIDGGWQVLVDGLLAVCRDAGVHVQHHAPAVSVADTPGGWRVELPGAAIEARQVVLAAGGPAEAARLIGRDPWGDLGGPVTAAALDVAVTTPPPVPLLFSLDEPLYLSQHSPTTVHLLRYDARGAAVDRVDLLRHAALAGLDVDVAPTSRFLARMVVAHSAPTPACGGMAGRPGVAVPGCEGVFVAGDWVGTRGMLADATLASAEEAAAAVLTRPPAAPGGSPAGAARVPVNGGAG